MCYRQEDFDVSTRVAVWSSIACRYECAGWVLSTTVMFSEGRDGIDLGGLLQAQA